MPVIVVGGSGRNVGKTSLVCGLILALPEFSWIAVKITSHEHSMPGSVWEECEAGHGRDTARYLRAGARRAFLVTSEEAELAERMRELQAKVGSEAPLIFESNRIVEWLQLDLRLAVRGGGDAKASFTRFAQRADAMVMRGDRDEMIADEKPQFQLAELTQVSMEMQRWLRDRLACI